MPISQVDYPLQNGFIVNWLTAGPQVIPITDSMDRAEIARRYYDEKSQISVRPVERGPIHEGAFTIGDFHSAWSYTACRDDRLVDHSAAYPNCAFVRSWAFVELASPAQQNAAFTLFTCGPADVWVNKKHQLHHEEFSEQLQPVKFSAELDKGSNRILVRFAALAQAESRHAFALRLDETAGGITARIPTLIGALERRAQIEQINRRLYLDRDIYYYDQKITLSWPQDLDGHAGQDARLQTHAGRIYAQTEDAGKPGDQKIFAMAVTLSEGPYHVFAMPRALEYYDNNIRVEKYFDLYATGRSRFSEAPYGTPADRRNEALRHAITFEQAPFAEIARMALGDWDNVQAKPIQQALESIRALESGSDMLLLGLLGALARYGQQGRFDPTWKAQIATAAQGFAYAQSIEFCSGLAFHLPDRQIVFHACAILAGQLFPEARFERAGCSGLALAEQANAQALAWIRARGGAGFAAWDSSDAYGDALAALSHLVDLAEDQSVFELSSVLMDKILFSIALNSFDGTYGAAQGYATTLGIKSGLTSATAGVTRLLWGVGIFNRHVNVTVSMAQMENYEFPPLIAEIAVNEEPLWSRSQHALGDIPANTVTYRTGDYMLSSVQDYRPGQPGSREQVWQATLSPQAVVFSNHPGSASQNDAHAPNFWLGNGALPRVAQWQDTLIALYNLPEEAWMDFTHAYFPTIEFDETVVEGDTIFGRKGEGYIALTAANGLSMPAEGVTAHRELRSPGRQNIWVCRMGRASEDGDFAAFQVRMRENKPIFDGLRVQVSTSRGEVLSFGWQEPFLRDDVEVPLRDFPHYDNPFAAAGLNSDTLEIKNEAYLLRLNFGDTADEDQPGGDVTPAE